MYTTDFSPCIFLIFSSHNLSFLSFISLKVPSSSHYVNTRSSSTHIKSIEPSRIHHSAHTHLTQQHPPPQGKGYKLPHGLTVKELKDMTSARLAAEARQKDMLDAKTHTPSLHHSSSSVSSTHSNRSKNSVGLILERSSMDQVAASHLISSHVQKFQGISENLSAGRPASKPLGTLSSSTGFMPQNNPTSLQFERICSDFDRNLDLNPSLNLAHRNYPTSRLQPQSFNSHNYMCHDISRSMSYPVPGAAINQPYSYAGSPVPESVGTFIPLSRSSVTDAEEASSNHHVIQDQNIFAPVVTFGESYLVGSYIASRGSSPTDSKTDDRSSLITENGWLDIFGRPSSAATIPTIIPSSESFCPEDDNYTVTFSPEHHRISNGLCLDERGVSSFSPNNRPFRVKDFRIDGKDIPNQTNVMPMIGVFRSLPSDHCEIRPVSSYTTSFHALSPLRSESDVNDSFLNKSWTNSFAEDYEDAINNEEDELALNRLENDLNALLTIGHEPNVAGKNDFFVSKLDPIYDTQVQPQSVVGNPPQSKLQEEAPVITSKTTDPRPSPLKKNSSGRKSSHSHRHRHVKKKDHAFNG